MAVRIGVGVMAALLVFYLVVVVQLAIELLTSGGMVSFMLGAALLILPLLAFWGLTAEILFGFRSERLGNIMGREGTLPEDEFEHLPSGRPDPKSVRPHVPLFVAQAESSPHDWRAAYRLGLVLDAAGERRLARREVVRAIRLERAERDAASAGPTEAS